MNKVVKSILDAILYVITFIVVQLVVQLAGAGIYSAINGTPFEQLLQGMGTGDYSDLVITAGHGHGRLQRPGHHHQPHQQRHHADNLRIAEMGTYRPRVSGQPSLGNFGVGDSLLARHHITLAMAL